MESDFCNSGLPIEIKLGEKPVKDDVKMSDSLPNSMKDSALETRDSQPINWFPRKKTDSYLKRKIQHLQEVGGMNLSLDETLNSANPHYTRMAREKIATQEAAKKAMKLRKIAMIQASWCRILHAARINSKEAEQVLEKAEREAEDALEAVSSKTDSISFVTVFEVDKEVSMAVKKAFIRLAKSPSYHKEEFKELIHKIRENPDDDDDDNDYDDNDNDNDGLVNLMFDRVKGLSEEEISSLAVIVAAAGLGEALVKTDPATFSSRIHQSKRRRGGEMDVPGLDKFLVKHISRLEKEVQEAKVLKKTDADVAQQKKKKKNENDSMSGDLGSILVRHVSRLEREISSFKDSLKQQRISEGESVEKDKGGSVESHVADSEELKKLMRKSTFGQPIAETESEKVNGSSDGCIECNVADSEKVNGSSEELTTNRDEELKAAKGGFDECHVADSEEVNNLTKKSTLSQPMAETQSEFDRQLWKGEEEEKTNLFDELHMSKKSTLQKGIGETECAGLDWETSKKVRNSVVGPSLEETVVKPDADTYNTELDKAECGKKDQNLMAGPALEEEKSTISVKPSATFREARDRRLQDSWGGLSLENSLKPHLSRLAREKAAWKRAEEEEKIRGRV